MSAAREYSGLMAARPVAPKVDWERKVRRPARRDASSGERLSLASASSICLSIFSARCAVGESSTPSGRIASSTPWTTWRLAGACALDGFVWRHTVPSRR